MTITSHNQFMRSMVMKGVINADEAGTDLFVNDKTPEQKDGFTHIAEIDRELASGLIPEELKYDTGMAQFEKDKSCHRQKLTADLIPFIFGGNLLGMSLAETPAIAQLASSLPVPAAVTCAVAGSIAGAAIAWLRRKKEDCADVSVDIDGKKYQVPYYINPNHYVKSPEMLRFVMTAQGLLGDKIAAHKLKDGDIPSNPDITKLNDLKTHSKELVKLASERRLVASFGEKSRYGKEALQLIDANLAGNLIAGGKEVFLVNVQETTNIPHHYTADLLKGNNTTHITSMKETYDYQETKFSYSLTPMNSATDLENIKNASGIPEGIMGVYKDSDTYSEVVFSDKQYGYGEVKNGCKSSTEIYQYDRKSSGKISNPSIESADDVKPRFINKPNFPYLLGLIGAIAGGSTALSIGLMGLPAGALMACGFVAGKFIGTKIF